MTLHYLDPSAWIKRHFEETGSDVVNALFRTPINAACCRLGMVEMVATIARKSQQQQLEKSVEQSLVDNVVDDFKSFQVVSVDEERIVAATDLARRHRLRTMDALHLASALFLRDMGDVVIVSADAELLAAAGREGLETLNPNRAP